MQAHFIGSNCNYASPVITYTISSGYGDEAMFLRSVSGDLGSHFTFPISLQTLEQKFDSLSATWKDNIKMVSSVSEIITSSSYLEIIAMGKPAVALILSDLKVQPNHWFIALSAITGANPIKNENRGNMALMTEDWLNWGRENGYII